jgi:hypothetical protein
LNVFICISWFPARFKRGGVLLRFWTPVIEGHPLFCHEATIPWLHLRKGIGLQGSGSIFGYRVKCARIERALRSELSPCAELAEVKLCPKSARDAPWLCHEKQKRMGGDMPHLPPMTIQYFEYLKSWSIGLDHFIWANGGDPNTKAVAESLFCTFGMPKNTKAETKNTQ